MGRVHLAHGVGGASCRSDPEQQWVPDEGRAAALTRFSTTFHIDPAATAA